MRISDWSSDVCSSDLPHDRKAAVLGFDHLGGVAGRRLKRGLEDPAGQGGVLDRLPVRSGSVAGDSLDGGESQIVCARGFFQGQIGRASCRERVCQYVLISVVSV